MLFFIKGFVHWVLFFQSQRSHGCCVEMGKGAVHGPNIVFFLHLKPLHIVPSTETPVAASDLSRSRAEQALMLHRVYLWPDARASDFLRSGAGTANESRCLSGWLEVGGKRRWKSSQGCGRHMLYASACRYIFKNLQLEVRVLHLGVKSVLYPSLDILNRVTLVQCEIKLL